MTSYRKMDQVSKILKAFSLSAILYLLVFGSHLSFFGKPSLFWTTLLNASLVLSYLISTITSVRAGASL
jgi:hypothetical protein